MREVDQVFADQKIIRGDRQPLMHRRPAGIGVAMEIGIEPTARHGADLGYIPVIVTDACGAGDEAAARRSIESLKFAGDAIFTDTEKICAVLGQGAGGS